MTRDRRAPEAPSTVPVIEPEWPAPDSVRACTTLRGGAADTDRSAFASMNFALHVGDDPQRVADNRRRLRENLRLPAEPAWLRQVHGTHIVDAHEVKATVEADGSVADRAGVVCAVLTADCLPVVLCDVNGRRIAVLHVGWRGLAAGVVEAGVARMGLPPRQLLAWMGPAIGPDAFEVGGEVREAITAGHPQLAAAFHPSPRGGRWMADLYALARGRLAAAGVHAPYGGGWCTMTDAARFFSYRRDGRTGRMATLAWIEP